MALVPDIIQMVVECLVEDFANEIAEPLNNQRISRLSVVCQDWGKRLRPILFRQILIVSKDDLTTLVHLIASPHSRLINIIGAVDVMPMRERLLDVPWLHLIPATLRCKTRALYLDHPLGGAYPPSLSSIHPALPRGLPRCFASYTVLHLHKHYFKSFSELSRLVSGMPKLQELELRFVGLGSPTLGERRSRSIRPRNLTTIRTTNLLQVWDLSRLSPQAPSIATEHNINASVGQTVRLSCATLPQDEFKDLEETVLAVARVFNVGYGDKGSIILASDINSPAGHTASQLVRMSSSSYIFEDHTFLPQNILLWSQLGPTPSA